MASAPPQREDFPEPSPLPGSFKPNRSSQVLLQSGSPSQSYCSPHEQQHSSLQLFSRAREQATSDLDVGFVWGQPMKVDAARFSKRPKPSSERTLDFPNDGNGTDTLPSAVLEVRSQPKQDDNVSTVENRLQTGITDIPISTTAARDSHSISVTRPRSPGPFIQVILKHKSISHAATDKPS